MRLLFFVYIIASISIISCKDNDSQKKNTQATEGVGNVLQSFGTRYPNAQDVVWDTLEIGWVATFNNGKNDCKAFYDLKGNFQYTTTLIAEDEMPPAIKQELDKKYKSYTVAIVQEVFDGKAKLFQVEIETDREYVALEFDEKGKFLKEIKQPLSTEEIQRQEEEGVDDNDEK